MNPSLPDMVPVLSRGKHRRPEDGACFMEMASVLAGSRWSDSPPGTHPLLAHLARLVNDATSDDGRASLAPMVPSVIGLDSTEPRWEDAIALLAAAVALPMSGRADQRALAAGLLSSDALLVADDDAEIRTLRATARSALARTPDARTWAQEFTDRLGPARTRERAGGPIVEYAVRSIVAGAGPRADDTLRALLGAAIDLCQRLAGHEQHPLGAPDAARSAELTGAGAGRR